MVLGCVLRTSTGWPPPQSSWVSKVPGSSSGISCLQSLGSSWWNGHLPFTELTAEEAQRAKWGRDFAGHSSPPSWCVPSSHFPHQPAAPGVPEFVAECEPVISPPLERPGPCPLPTGGLAGGRPHIPLTYSPSVCELTGPAPTTKCTAFDSVTPA